MRNSFSLDSVGWEAVLLTFRAGVALCIVILHKGVCFPSRLSK